MNSTLFIIDQLAGLEHDGIITDEESVLLRQLTSEDKDAMAYYQAKRALAKNTEIEQLVTSRDASANLLKVWENVQVKNKKTVVIKRILTVAAAAILVGCAVIAVRLVPDRQNTVAKNDKPVKQAIELTLPNGERVDLSSNQGQMKIGNTTINNNNKSLSYSAAGNTGSGGISTLLVPIGKDYRIELSDGTIVFLNSATSLQFPLVFMNTREITIKGEAYLQIATDAEKPFIVHLPNMDLRVLGTEFNVNTYDKDSDKVALVNGAVSLNRKNESPNKNQGKTLKPGQQAVASSKEMIIESYDPEYTLSWRKGYYRFDNIPLSKICEVIPRWFGNEVKIDNPKIANLQYSGALYRNTPLKDQLAPFQIDGQVSYYWEGDVLHFK